MISNEYSGTLHFTNLVNINKLYEIMREALLYENSIQNNQIRFITEYQPQPTRHPSSLLNNKNPQKLSKLFITNNGPKIFQIIRDVPYNSKKQSVKIIYNNDDYYDENDEEYDQHNGVGEHHGYYDEEGYHDHHQDVEEHHIKENEDNHHHIQYDNYDENHHHHHQLINEDNYHHEDNIEGDEITLKNPLEDEHHHDHEEYFNPLHSWANMFK